MDYSLAGRLTVVLILNSVALYLVYRFFKVKRTQLRLRRSIKEFKARRYEEAWTEAIDEDLRRRVQRQRKLLKIADSVVEDTGYQDRMRIAESLGFFDEEAPTPPRAA